MKFLKKFLSVTNIAEKNLNICFTIMFLVFIKKDVSVIILTFFKLLLSKTWKWLNSLAKIKYNKNA